ncbi:MAG: hypothetical protein ACQGTM_15540 [bacterium]
MRKKKCSSETAAQSYISPRKISELLDVPYARVLEMIQDGCVSAVKKNKRWLITEEQYAKFKTGNGRKIKRLQDEYFDLYRQGLTHYQLQRRVSSDFKRLGIICPIPGFAEQAIYEKLKAGEAQ